MLPSSSASATPAHCLGTAATTAVVMAEVLKGLTCLLLLFAQKRGMSQERLHWSLWRVLCVFVCVPEPTWRALLGSISVSMKIPGNCEVQLGCLVPPAL